MSDQGRQRQSGTSYHMLIDAYYFHSRNYLIYTANYIFSELLRLCREQFWAQRSKHGGLGRVVDAHPLINSAHAARSWIRLGAAALPSPWLTQADGARRIGALTSGHGGGWTFGSLYARARARRRSGRSMIRFGCVTSKTWRQGSERVRLEGSTLGAAAI